MLVLEPCLECLRCNGSGRPSSAESSPNVLEGFEVCLRCHGTGWLNAELVSSGNILIQNPKKVFPA